MKTGTVGILDTLFERYPALCAVRPAVFRAAEVLIACYRGDGKVLTCGNGGSCSDGSHLVGELMKSFILPRTIPQDTAQALLQLDPENGAYMAARLQGALPAVSLAGETALTTAYGNDVAPDMIYAQQVWGYGRPGDVLLALSTSGRSRNVVLACTAARLRQMKVIGLTGAEGRDVGARSDVLIAVPETETYRVQELHLPVWHALCLALEEEFFGA